MESFQKLNLSGEMLTFFCGFLWHTGQEFVTNYTHTHTKREREKTNSYINAEWIEIFELSWFDISNKTSHIPLNNFFFV